MTQTGSMYTNGTAYIDTLGGCVFQARWFSKDEGRYYVIAKGIDRSECARRAIAKGFNVVQVK